MLDDLETGMTLFLDWTHGGVNFSGPGSNGGLDCRDHVTDEHRVVESVVGIVLTVVSGLIGFRLSKTTGKTNTNNNNDETTTAATLSSPARRTTTTATMATTSRSSFSSGRIFLLVLHSFVFGVEVGFKFSSRTLIFLLNPCHVVTGLQLYLLASPAGKYGVNMKIYRLMLHYLHGSLAAILFPVTECLHLPFEVSIYWIQHYLLLIVPFYLLICDDEISDDGVTYTAHEIFDLSWIFGSFSLWSFWHWGVMQGVGYFTLVNVGSMLCPAPSDPFAGPGYRLVGIIHQFLAICFFGTLAAIVGQRKRLKHLNMKASGKMD